jgi:hypothetical protein
MPYRVLVESPQRLTKEQMDENMASEFEPFKLYIEYLAQGKLDGYLNSNLREDKPLVPDIATSNDPNLLLHDLGKYADMDKINGLFVEDVVYVFNQLTRWLIYSLQAPLWSNWVGKNSYCHGGSFQILGILLYLQEHRDIFVRWRR